MNMQPDSFSHIWSCIFLLFWSFSWWCRDDWIRQCLL